MVLQQGSRYLDALSKAVTSALDRDCPPYVMWYATRRCNCRCSFCSVSSENREEMPINEVRHLARQCFDSGVAIVNIQGGEPFLRNDIEKCVEAFLKAGLHTGVITNGTIASSEQLIGLVEMGASVCISLDTLKREKYVRLRGADHLAKVCDIIEHLPFHIRRQMSVHMTVNILNMDEVFQLAEYANGLGYPLSVLPVVGGRTMRHRRKDDELLSASTSSQLSDCFRAIIKNYGRYRWLVSLDVLEAIVSFLEIGSCGNCGAAQFSLVIDSDGAVAPCPDLPPFGSLKQTSLRNLIDLRSSIRSQIDKCQQDSACFYGCTVAKRIAFERPDHLISNLLATKYGYAK